MRPFRFGVNTWAAASSEDWIGKARRLEQLGYSTLVMPDHLTDTLAPFAALGAAAAATSSLRVGPFVLNNDLRHPVVVAREIATMDVLTGGRVELGLGAGYGDAEYREAGLAFDRGAVRVTRLAEAVRVIKALFAGGPVSFEGSHYKISGHSIWPSPIQRPRPPLLLGGNGKEMLTLAGREADIVGLTGATFPPRGRPPEMTGFGAAAFAERVGWVMAAVSGRANTPELNVLVQDVVIADSPRQAFEGSRFRSLDVEDALGSPFLLLGSVEQVAETLRERRERWGISYIVVFDRCAEEFAPVVERLAGT
jgi:probable F420-dependent oxidoreductase